MFTSTLQLVPVLCLLLSVTATNSNSPPYIPTDIILLNCGESSSNTTSPDGRNWEGDAQSKFTPSNLVTESFVSRASQQDQSVPEVPYMTARIFRSEFTYTLPVTAGPKFLRLYFYPVSYSPFNITTSFFSVSANNYTLLNNFSALLTLSAIVPPVDFFVKEFVITVTNDQMLKVSFTPSPSSLAFINGIEVVSMPNNLYGQSDNPIPFVNNEAAPFYFDDSTALETAYRINVGGQHVSVTEDTGMFRDWKTDVDYIYGQAIGTNPFLPDATINYTKATPAYVAPEIVYKTSRTMGRSASVNKNYNLTWTFPVDTGFNYLVRLHFCETQLEVKRVHERVFSIFINNQTAVADADVINWSGGSGIPVYKDFVVWVPFEKQSQQELWLALHPFLDLDPPAKNVDAILNGLEIFKLNNSNGSLAGRNPEPKFTVPTPLELQPRVSERTKNKTWRLVLIIIAALLGGVFVLSLLCFIVLRRKRKVLNDSATTTKETKSSWGPISYTVTSTATNNSSLPSDICRRISIAEIKEATSHFDDQYIVGTGGFGHVYKGYLDGSTTVAIKRLNSSSNQGTREFHTEIEMISKVRHLHIVSLIGYCDDRDERILVYEYMSRGNLRDHLYKTRNPPLPWKRRLEICIAAARGLHYLHAGAKHTIIHRDIKSTNMLLDENWVAKISDFGLSKLGPTGMSQTHVSTVVKGSFGYVDPEYFRRQQLTEKSDVYSFGVVLLEVLCARPPVMNGVPKEEVSLPVWVRLCQARGTIDQIIDPNLSGQISRVCLNKFVEIAETCVRDEGIQRPTMGDVVWGLEFALQLQETSDKNIGQIELNESNTSAPHGEVTTTTDDDEIFSGSGGHVSDSRSTISSGGKSINKYDGDHRMNSETVFSELMHPKGR